jgi:hypothetical protein
MTISTVCSTTAALASIEAKSLWVALMDIETGWFARHQLFTAAAALLIAIIAPGAIECLG